MMLQRKSMQRAPKIYSVPALLTERVFAGKVEVSGVPYAFTYAPARAEVVAGKLQLSGRLTLTDIRGRKRERPEVRATLEGQQGGLGASPIRRQLLAGGAQTGTTATAEQKQQQASEEEKKLGETAATPMNRLPLTEATGRDAFCGVLYFRFEALDGQALGVAADLSRVQLNARLAPVDDRARQLRDLYSLIGEALYGDRVDERVAAAVIGELNKAFAAG
jgi:hypothetical protein